MSEKHLKAEAGQDFDLDEDLFDFGEITDASWDEQEEADLDEIFADFEAEEKARKAAEEARADELFGEDDPDTLPAPEDFAGLNPDPPPAIPRPTERGQATAPPITAPTAEEARPAAPAAAAQPVQPAPVAPAEPATAPVPPAVAAQGLPLPPPQPIYYQTVAAAPVPAPAAPTGLFGMSRGVRVAAWILIAVTSINALVALVALKSTGDLRRSVQNVGEQVTQTATELMRENQRSAQELVPATRTSSDPLSAPNPENHPTFEFAREEIQRGEYTRARQRLYGLLAIVDRLDPLVREQVEARANYLLAQITHLQTLEQWEQRR